MSDLDNNNNNSNNNVGGQMECTITETRTNPLPPSVRVERGKYSLNPRSTTGKSKSCKICGRRSLYSCYTVRCCECCKQFFRRLVVNRQEYFCQSDSRCSMQRKNPCSGCRLDGCLLAGMQPQFVKGVNRKDTGWRQFLEILEARRKKAYRARRFLLCNNASAPERKGEKNIAKCKEDDDGEEGEEPAACYDEFVKEPMLPNVMDWRQLNVLMLHASRHKRNWDGVMELPRSLNQFASIEQLIQFPGRIMAAPSNPQKRAECRPIMEIKDNTTTWPPNETLNFICIDALLLLEWLRSMPIFMDFELNDQLVLLRHLHFSFAALCNAFYSVNVGIWTRKNGYIFCPNSSLSKDERLRLLSRKIFCNSVQNFKTVQIDQETFALLLGILCCDSNAIEQSAVAREHLYNQSVEYCRILMAFLQVRHGNEAGAKRFAECMHLLGQIFQLKYTYEQFTVYRAMLIQMTPEMNLKNAEPENLPRALRFFF